MLFLISVCPIISHKLDIFVPINFTISQDNSVGSLYDVVASSKFPGMEIHGPRDRCRAIKVLRRKLVGKLDLVGVERSWLSHNSLSET